MSKVVVEIPDELVEEFRQQRSLSESCGEFVHIISGR